ncbi:MAG: InlB B-repeat-containing protein, partial [Muribaculaceae bacterium]|nr:InlB B-repeat-containing protein [Muribaculaceae bacterium]
MDGQRAWIKSKRRKWLWGIALLLSISLLITSYPNILETLLVYAKEGQEDTIITGFAGLTEDVSRQTVPVGTELFELNLPDRLEACVSVAVNGTEDRNAEEKTGDDKDAAGEEQGTQEEQASEEKQVSEEEKTSEEEQAAEGIPEENQISGKEQAEEISEEKPEASEKPDGSMADGTLDAESGAAAMPEYQTENVVAVAALKGKTAADTDKPMVHTEENTAEKRIVIENITWESTPVYDSEMKGRYTFTPILPKGCILADGVSLPEIAVTVVEDRKNMALTAAGKIMEEILEKYFAGLTDDEIYAAICAMDADTRLSFIADYEELLAALTEEDEDDAWLQYVLGEMERGIADALAAVEDIEPVFFSMRAAAPKASGAVSLRRVSGEGEAFIYHSFVETTSFTVGETYAFLKGIYGYGDAVAALGSGAILRATDKSNRSGDCIKSWYGDSAEVKVYVEVVTPGNDFDDCKGGGLYQVPDSGTPTEYRYFCWAGGARNCGPYYAYTYEKQHLSYADVSASLNDIEKKGSEKSEDYTVRVAYNNGQSLTLDTGSYTVKIPDPASDEVIITVSDSEGNKIITNFVCPFVVTYDGNGEGVSNLPALQTVWRGEKCTLSAQTPTRSGYSFVNWKDTETGTTYAKGVTVTSSMQSSLKLQAQWKDVQPPTVDYTPVQVMTRTSDANVEKAVRDALTITDNEPVEECSVTVTVSKNLAATVGNKNVTVKVTDKAGNTTTKTCVVAVVSYVDISRPVFTQSTKNLSATLNNPGDDAITESGFVWGIMNSPTLTVNNGKKTTTTPVNKADDVISVTADNLQKGVTYYARAYVTAGGVTYYSEEITIGIGLPAYGTFTIKNNGNNTFTVTRTGGSEGAQTVYYRTVNGSAVGGTHFTHKYGSLTFAEGVTTQTITVTEQGVNTAYGSKPATAYTNADRTYQVEIYRVTGGGTLGDTVSATRTMTKGSNYTVDRSIYNEQTINGPQGETTRGDYDDDGLGWTDGKAYDTAKEDISIKEQLLPSIRNYWTNTAENLYYQLTFQAREENEGYQIIQITPGAALDTKIYPYKGDIKGERSTTYYVAQFDHEGSGNDKYYCSYTFPYTSASARKPDNVVQDDSRIKDNCVVFDITQENMVVGYGASGSNSDKWVTQTVKHHFWLRDSKEPQFLGVAPMAGGTYKVGDTFTVSLIFDEIVDQKNSGDLNGITVNTSWGTASYAGGADTNVLYFTGTVAANAESALKVNSFTNPDRIKDMCNNTSTTATTSGSGDTAASVNTAQPNFTLTPKGVANGTGTVQVTVLADKANTDSLRYVWSDSAAMPASGWVEASAAEVTSAKGTGLSLSIRKEAGSGSSNGKWYLHVIGTYNTTGATVYKSAYVDFGTKSSPAAGSTKPTLTVSTNNTSWATQRPITIKASGAETLAYRKSGDSAWTTLAANAGSVTVTENGYYTFKLTAGDDVITQSISVEKIDRTSPTASIGAPVESGTESTAKDGVYTKITLPITYADSQSGVKTVQYAWTNTQTTPTSWTTLASGTAHLTYTATESTETTKYLHLKVTDNVGYTYTTKSAAYTVIKQTQVVSTPPTITLTGAPTAWTNDMVTLEWALQNYAGKNYEVILPGGTKARTNATSGQIWATQNGTYTVKVRDTVYGAENTATVEVRYIDRTSPTVTTSTVSADWKTSKQTITLSASDSESGVGKKYYKIVNTDSEKPTEDLTELTTGSITVNKDGVWYVYYKIYDKAGDDAVGREGNMTEGFIGPIRIDTQTPSLSVTCADIGVPKSEGLSVSVKAEYGISGGSVKVGGNEITALTAASGSADEKIAKETEYKVTEKGKYQFTLKTGSGKTQTKNLNVYEVTFETGTDTETASQLAVGNALLTKPAEPEREGMHYTWKGWYTEETGGSLWNFETDKVSKNMTLYARWADETAPDAPVLKEGTVLPTDWTDTQKTIPLTLSDNIGVAKLWVSVDNGEYRQVTDFYNVTGSAEVDYTYTGVKEGEHSYRFKAEDAAGNTSGESAVFTVRLDTAKPVIGAITYENKAANLWNWIIGKKSLIIHVPVMDEGSGVAQITYTSTSDGGTAVTGTADVKNGGAQIKFSADFKGTITISCTDAAGNTADSVTIGASGGGVIVEDTAPVITTNVKTEYYDTAEDIHVTVKDDTRNAISAGIASVTYQVGDGEEKTTDYTSGADIKSEIEFDIEDSEISTGITEIKITATDNAGNTLTEKITVKVKGPEKQPTAAIDYREEELTGLVPGGLYKIGIAVNGTVPAYEEFTADDEGRIQIAEKWLGKTVSIVKKGNGSETTDSTAQSLSIPARPDKPTPTGVDVQTAGGTGKLTGLTAGTTYEVSTDGGRTWETRSADGSGEITGLAPGSYTVRVKAGSSNFASEPSEPAAIDAYQIKVTFIVDGETYDTISVDYGGTLTNIPAVPSKDSAVSDWYADEQGESLAVFANITADMTVYAVYTT